MSERLFLRSLFFERVDAVVARASVMENPEHELRQRPDGANEAILFPWNYYDGTLLLKALREGPGCAI
jgi:hypothetical protein